MKAKSSFGIFAVSLVGLITILSMVNFSPVMSSESLAGASSAVMQASPTPLVADGSSEVGSTDGILIMGIVIVLIVTIPLLFNIRQKK